MAPSPALLVFDWDGTLADSHAKIVDCFAVAIEQVGEAPRDRQELREVIGLGLPETARALFPAADDAFLERFVEAYRDHWLGAGSGPARLFEGSQSCIELLAQRGHRLAVATGKSRAGLDRELGETGLAPSFEATRCADETRSKPNPTMLLELLELTGVPAEQALMVGDTTFDLQMAAAVSVPSVGVSYGAHPVDALQRWKPRAILDSITELPPWILGGG